jgi:hypothetical protein
MGLNVEFELCAVTMCERSPGACLKQLCVERPCALPLTSRGLCGLHSLREFRIVRQNDANDDAEDTQRTCENLHNQNRHIQRRVLGVGKHAATASDTNGDSASTITNTSTSNLASSNGIDVYHDEAVPAG